VRVDRSFKAEDFAAAKGYESVVVQLCIAGVVYGAVYCFI